ncbi:DUF4407 domain-containing protein [Psychrobacter sp. I-STPA6b]|uniref:DUF4407 domain-containing protein n=1 Tax=Psychrobacter sp. I-STPA6b TaxID=2585718 RepID=UPI001D0C21F4|nr:DUF4407 domain-containing protein [Psychrobacter sp. I-STPA6b]
MKLNTPIKDILANFSGSDQITRDATGDFKPRITTFYALCGIWIIIIAVIGGAGGYFFAETFTDSKIVQWFVAILWGLVILIIEKFMIVIPMNHEDIWKNFVLVAFRLLLTFFASVTITDSVVVNYFYDDSITEILVENSNKKRLQEIENLQTKVTDTNNLFASRLRTLEEESICLTTLLREEKGSDNTTIKTIRTDSGVICGSTSGEGASCGDDCRQIQSKITEKEQEIAKVKADLADMLTPIQAELDRATKSTDYANDMIARTEALGELKDRHPSVAKTHFFFAGLLILAEMLVISIKILMPKLASDYVYESKLKCFDRLNTSEDELYYDFQKQVQQNRYKEQADYYTGVISALASKTSLQDILDVSEKIDESVNEHRKKQLKRTNFLKFNARRKILSEIKEVEEMAERAKRTARNKYNSKLDESTDTDIDDTEF